MHALSKIPSFLSTFHYGRLLSLMASIISELNITLLNRFNISNDVMKSPFNSDSNRNAKISFGLNLSIVIISLIGNPLTICVVLRKRFRQTSTGFYILCLAIYDIIYTIFWPLETATKVRKVVVSVHLHRNETVKLIVQKWSSVFRTNTIAAIL